MIGRLLVFVLFFSTCDASAATRPVLVLGDSLSAAYHIAPESGWVHLLEARLQQAPTPRAVVNASISGETTSGALARVDRELDRKSVV